MNRLTFARSIRRGGVVHPVNGGSHLHHAVSCYLKQIRTCYSSAEGKYSTWETRTWKETLAFIRSNYPRKTGKECDRSYVIWYEPSRNLNPFHGRRVNCTTPGEHTHCMECNEIALDRSGPEWCASCWKEADDKRKEITLAIIDYEDSFGLPFMEDREIRDKFEGNDDGPRECGERRYR